MLHQYDDDSHIKGDWRHRDGLLAGDSSWFMPDAVTPSQWADMMSPHSVIRSAEARLAHAFLEQVKEDLVRGAANLYALRGLPDDVRANEIRQALGRDHKVSSPKRWRTHYDTALAWVKTPDIETDWSVGVVCSALQLDPDLTRERLLKLAMPRPGLLTERKPITRSGFVGYLKPLSVPRDQRRSRQRKALRVG